MITRSEFIQVFPDGLANPDSPLWAYEDYTGFESQYFVKVHCVGELAETIGQTEKRIEYWNWCQHHLSRLPICYSSTGESEWWGFETEVDGTIWLLRWG